MWVMDSLNNEDFEAALDTALTYANGASVYELSAVERAAILGVYTLYDALLGQPHADLTPASTATARPFIEAAYSQVQIGGRLEGLRERLLASAIACPYCGFGEVRDLDHYLPKSDYGELAIYPRNLVPSCSSCNNAKRKIVPGVPHAYGPGLIHPYFELLPDVEFLLAEVTFVGGALEVTFQIDPTQVPAVADKLQFQLDRLKLNDRYPKQINKFLSEQRTAILMFESLGSALLTEFLIRSAADLADSFGRNDWRPALVRALSQNDEFCASPQLYFGVAHHDDQAVIDLAI